MVFSNKYTARHLWDVGHLHLIVDQDSELAEQKHYN